MLEIKGFMQSPSHQNNRCFTSIIPVAIFYPNFPPYFENWRDLNRERHGGKIQSQWGFLFSHKSAKWGFYAHCVWRNRLFNSSEMVSKQLLLFWSQVTTAWCHFPHVSPFIRKTPPVMPVKTNSIFQELNSFSYSSKIGWHEFLGEKKKFHLCICTMSAYMYSC